MEPSPVTASPESLGQQVGPPGLIVDVLDQDVLDAHPTLAGVRIVPCGVQHRVHVEVSVQRDQFVAQLIVRRVQREREGDGQILVYELPHPRHHPDGGDGQAPGADPQSVRGRCVDLPHRRQHRLVVGHRLAHPHEDNVVHVARPARKLPGAQPAGGVMHLPDDLAGGQVTLQPALACGAERTGHATTGLRRDADGGASGVAHDDRLDHRPIESAPGGLDRQAGVRRLLADRHEQGREELVRNLLPDSGGQIGPAGRICVQAGKPLGRDLLGPEGGQPEFADRLDTLGRGEVHPVRRGPAAGRDELAGQIDGPGGRGHGNESARSGQDKRPRTARPWSSSDQQQHGRPSERGGDQERIQPVHGAPVPRHERAHVLDARVPLDHRLHQVANGGSDRE